MQTGGTRRYEEKRKDVEPGSGCRFILTWSSEVKHTYHTDRMQVSWQGSAGIEVITSHKLMIKLLILVSANMGVTHQMSDQALMWVTSNETEALVVSEQSTQWATWWHVSVQMKQPLWFVFYCGNVKPVSDRDQAQAHTHTPNIQKEKRHEKPLQAVRRIITQTPGDCSSRSTTSNWSLLTKSERFILVFTKNEKLPVCPVTMYVRLKFKVKAVCYTYSEKKQPPGFKSCRKQKKTHCGFFFQIHKQTLK